MSDSTFHLTKEDVRKPQANASQSNSGNVPGDSDAAQAQVRADDLSPNVCKKNKKLIYPKSIVDQANQSKADVINERVAGLPKPEQPPVASDFNSADPSTVSVGSGGISGGTNPEPSTGHSSVRVDGDANKVNTAPHGGVREGAQGGLPNDGKHT